MLLSAFPVLDGANHSLVREYKWKDPGWLPRTEVSLLKVCRINLWHTCGVRESLLKMKPGGPCFNSDFHLLSDPEHYIQWTDGWPAHPGKLEMMVLTAGLEQEWTGEQPTPSSILWTLFFPTIYKEWRNIFFFTLSVAPHGIWDLNSLTTDWTQAPCIGSAV